MIAVAVESLIPNPLVNYNGDGDGAHITCSNRKDGVIIIPLPRIAYEKMQRFDIADFHKDDEEIIKFRQNMESFSFEIDIPPGLISCIGISEVYKILSESKSLEPVKKYCSI